MSNDEIKIEHDLFKVIHDRRSIRKFLDKEVSDEVIDKILSAGIRAPFAYQSCSIVYTRDKEKMKKLRMFSSTKLYMVFFIDFNRMEKILKQRNYTYDFDDSLLLWMGVQDVSLVVQNVILAADALGLGSVLLGGAPFQVDKITEVFEVPRKTFPVVSMCLGYPDPEHKMHIRPRYPLKLSAYEDKYNDLSEEEIKECMKAMDEGYITQGYYIKLGAKIPLKEGKDEIDLDKYSWSEHISRKITQGAWYEESLLSLLRKQGFKLD